MFRSLKGVDSLRLRFTAEGSVGFLVARLEGKHCALSAGGAR